MKAHLVAVAVLLAACGSGTRAPAGPSASASAYTDNTGRADVLTGGVRMIPITTPSGTYKVWTKRVGNNPRIKVLLLHGGPGMTHEYFEAFDSYFPGAAVEYYYYDQLESGNSDRPERPELWDLARYVDEVEQVRVALGLDASNFYLLGHSWGGLLAIEYALAHQDQLKGLVISNMMASIPAYNEYAKTVLMPAMPRAVLDEVLAIEAAKQYEAPRYLELLIPHFYELHILRRPFAEWPEPAVRSFTHLSRKLYVAMQGPSEMGASGILERWDRFADLPSIQVPTLVIGAAHDTMDPAYMKRMAESLPRGRYLHCPDGSHMAIYDDQATYMAGVLRFLRDVDGGSL